MKIRKIQARTIFNTLGQKTIEVTINRRYRASVPLGLSPGKHEVFSFPQNGIPLSVVNRTFHRGLKGFVFQDFKDLEDVEKILFDYDSSEKLEKIGGNTIIALEYALLRAVSKENVWKFLNSSADELPLPMGCCIGGGKHHQGESIDFQEILFIPHGETFHDNEFINRRLYKHIHMDLKPRMRTATGGWVVLQDHAPLLEYLGKLRDEVYDTFGIHVSIGIDVAGSHLFRGKNYFYRNGALDRENHIKYLNTLTNRFSIDYLEDPLDVADDDGLRYVKGQLLCGDDLTCTQLARLEVLQGKINCVCVKPTQVGSLIKTKQFIDCAKQHHIDVVISHRSGETDDPMIADLSVGWHASYLKTGICGFGQAEKIRRMREIEKEIT